MRNHIIEAAVYGAVFLAIIIFAVYRYVRLLDKSAPGLSVAPRREPRSRQASQQAAGGAGRLDS